jgi:hypothetical protein
VSAAHIVVRGEGPEGGAECLNCGAKLLIQLPVLVDDWLASMKSFTRRHRKCRRTA